MRQSGYSAHDDDSKRSARSSTAFDMDFGIVNPSATYDDPASWCHPSATSNRVAQSHISNLASSQEHVVSPQRDHSHVYSSQPPYYNVPPDRAQQHSGPHATTSYDIPNHYRALQESSVHRSLHVRTDASVHTPSGTFLPRQDTSSLGIAPLSEAAVQQYVSPHARYTHDTANTQDIPALRNVPHSTTMPYLPVHPSSASTSAYSSQAVPSHIVTRNSPTIRQMPEQDYGFPNPGFSHDTHQQPSTGHSTADRYYSTGTSPSQRSQHPRHRYGSSPYPSPTSTSSQSSSGFASSPETSSVPLVDVHPLSLSSSSCASSSAASSPTSETATLQPSSSARTASSASGSRSADRFPCPYCPGDRSFSRTKDLERHIQSIHFRDPDAPEWICCGVPLSEADRWNLPEWVRREPPYMLNGIPMVGGCKEQCSRKDVLKRHLRKNEKRCFGSESAPWLPGNQKHKRPPRGGGNSGGSSSGAVGRA
ncbi:hypothetical protein BD311DRAFT_650492 [Dichomitus squalens]|uniref:C2H2-type domain-containing protein n=1 Tax=Dichomitus squalens TaxID=114155 RepID=A0A4Q9N0N8_9APHY|nr:hypothetical protein BD311DRAFT_650492 [Dichomitus squalens]